MDQAQTGQSTEMALLERKWSKRIPYILAGLFVFFMMLKSGSRGSAYATLIGGVLVALAQRFGLPVYALGVGETVDDLRPFEAREFARALMNLES